MIPGEKEWQASKDARLPDPDLAGSPVDVVMINEDWKVKEDNGVQYWQTDLTVQSIIEGHQ